MSRSLDEFAAEMADFMPRYKREAFEKFAMSSSVGDITVSQMMILNVLKTTEQCRMNEIAKALRVTTSAATGIVDRMVRGDLLKRTPSEKDRRVINIGMTNKGKKIVESLARKHYDFIIDVFGKVPAVERERFLDTMKKIYKIMRGQHR